jgi:hypothetical protein
MLNVDWKLQTQDAERQGVYNPAYFYLFNHYILHEDRQRTKTLSHGVLHKPEYPALTPSSV